MFNLCFRPLIRIAGVALATIFLSTVCSQGRDFIRIVGSSTVYPFMSLAAEGYSMQHNSGAPMVEANGTGGGFSQFCKGVGFDYPDINDASRPMSQSEREACKSNGVTDILEITIGYDGIALVYPKSLPANLNLTKRDIFLALSKMVPSKTNPKVWVPNFYQNWHTIDRKLPNLKIRVMGPPSTSGTRDVLVEMLAATCKTMLHGSREDNAACGQIRYDGAWQDGSENYNLVLQKVISNPGLFAVMGFNYYSSSASKINLALIEGVAINKANISAHKYALARPLFVYVKKAHLQAIPGLKDFVEFLIQPENLGSKGFLIQRGLIPLPESVYQKMVAQTKEQLGN